MGKIIIHNPEEKIIPEDVIEKLRKKAKQDGHCQHPGGWTEEEDKILIQVYEFGRRSVSMNNIIDLLQRYGKSGRKRTKYAVEHRVKRLKNNDFIPKFTSDCNESIKQKIAKKAGVNNAENKS